MGRSEELSEFQRGNVVGCYLCKKSVREISALLNLPRSTVSRVILNWKRGGITTALPRCGRPHKLREVDRQVLERVALEQCLPSVAAVTSELQSATGVSVSKRTVRRELHEMGFRGRVPSYNKLKVPEETKLKDLKKQDEPPPDGGQVEVSRLDLRVGSVVTALQYYHGLYLQVDVGEAAPRTVVNQLGQHISVAQLQNHKVVMLCNLKQEVMKDVVSNGIILCATSLDKVEILEPPPEAAPGDRVTFQTITGEPDEELNPAEKIWEQIQPELQTDAQCVATYKGTAMEVVGKGVCKAPTLSNSEIK